VSIARDLFDVPMLQGPVEDQTIAPGSVDAVVLLDVVEHFPDPVASLKRCIELLSPAGFLLIQTPSYPECTTLEELQRQGHRFPEMLKPDEHLYLFSHQSIARLLAELGCTRLNFEPALFAHYDMFLTASREPLRASDPDEREAVLTRAPSGRMVQSALDLYARWRAAEGRFLEADADRRDRLDAIEQLNHQLAEAETDRTARLENIARLEGLLHVSDTDRAGRLAAIGEIEARLKEAEADRAARLAAVVQLEAQFKEADADRTARYDAIRALEAQLRESETDRAARLTAIESLTALLEASEADRATRLEMIQRLQDALQKATPGSAAAGD